MDDEWPHPIKRDYPDSRIFPRPCLTAFHQATSTLVVFLRALTSLFRQTSSPKNQT
jgi:hypothetical protein